MTPIFLPQTNLDTGDLLGIGLLPNVTPKGQDRLRTLRDDAISKGAHVMLLVWPSREWVMLSIEPPEGIPAEDTEQLIPSVRANATALELMLTNSRHGNHLFWMSLSRIASQH